MVSVIRSAEFIPCGDATKHEMNFALHIFDVPLTCLRHLCHEMVQSCVVGMAISLRGTLPLCSTWQSLVVR